MIDPLSPLSAIRPFGARRRDEEELTPEEEESLIRHIGRKSLGGLAVAGNVLDTAGGTIRSALAGKNPLRAGFDPEYRESGRDLLEKLGILGRNREGLDVGDVAGFALEVALDPLTYLTLGGSALTKAGKIAKNAGTLTKQTRAAQKTLSTQLGRNVGKREARIEEGLGGLANFMGQTLGTGETGKKIARRLDDLGERVRYSGLGRLAHQTFNPKVMGTSTREGQQIAESLFDAQTEAIQSAKRDTSELAMGIHRADPALLDQNNEAVNRLYEYFEEVPGLHVPGQIAPLVQDVQGELAQLLDDAAEWGVDISVLDDEFIQYFPRRTVEDIRRRGKAGPLSAFDPHSIAREDILKDLPEGTAQIRRLGPQVKAFLEQNPEATIDDIAEQLMGDVPDQFFIRRGFDENGIPLVEEAAGRQRRLASFLKAQTPESLEAGVYGHPLSALEGRLTTGREAIEAGRHVLEALADTRLIQSASQGARSYVPARDLIRKLGLGEQSAMRKLAQLRGVDPEDAEAVAALGNMLIPEGLAADMGRYFEAFKGPEVANTIMQAVDSVTNLIKGGLTTVFPAFHVRNLFSGQYRNWQAGLVDLNRLPAALASTQKILRGEVVEDAVNIPAVQARLAEQGIPLTAQNATDTLRAMAYEFGVGGRYQGEVAQHVGVTAGGQLEDVLAEFPGGLGGSRPVRAKDIGMKAIAKEPGATWVPWHQRGVNTGILTGDVQDATRFGWSRAGEEVGYVVESYNRLTPFVEQLRHGVDPAEAARRTLDAQVDYSNRNFTQMERAIGLRLFPFYKFQKSQVPYVLRSLWERPGGKMAQTIRGINAARGDTDLLPEYLSETTAIRLPDWLSPTSDPRFVTGLGLMLEDPFSFVDRPGLEALSRLNPILKGPLEAATGQSFFQHGPIAGRPLEDLDPTVGRTFANLKALLTGEESPQKAEPFISQGFEHILANSPISRVLTTLRQASDYERKGLLGILANVGTGFRVTDVPERVQDAVLRDELSRAQAALGAKQFTKTFFPEELLATMTPEQRLYADRMNALQAMLAKRAKERREEEKRNR